MGSEAAYSPTHANRRTHWTNSGPPTSCQFAPSPHRLPPIPHCLSTAGLRPGRPCWSMQPANHVMEWLPIAHMAPCHGHVQGWRSWDVRGEVVEGGTGGTVEGEFRTHASLYPTRSAPTPPHPPPPLRLRLCILGRVHIHVFTPGSHPGSHVT